MQQAELSSSRRSQGKTKRSQESLRDAEAKEAFGMQNARMSDAVADLGTQLKVHQAGRRAESQGHTNQRRNPDDQLLPDDKTYANGDAKGEQD